MPNGPRKLPYGCANRRTFPAWRQWHPLEAQIEKLRVPVPELLEANGLLIGESAPFELPTRRFWGRQTPRLMADFNPKLKTLPREAGPVRPPGGRRP